MTHSIRFPKPLRPGDKIAVTAPSAGTSSEHYPRLDLVLGHLRSKGFVIVEGECLRGSYKHVSAPKEKRADDFLRFWNDPEIRAIMPPWGGDLLIELLPLIDFKELGLAEPKWISGYSDVSTLTFAVTLVTGVATLHGSNLMELSPTQLDPLTTGLIRTMGLASSESFIQESSDKYQKQWLDFRNHVDAPLNLTETTQWKILNPSGAAHQTFEGRLIGGCLDTIARLVGTPFGDLASFKNLYCQSGVIFYFENCEMAPCELARALWNLRLAGWFNGLSGILIGRSAGPDSGEPEKLSYEEALRSVLGDLGVPVIYDADIGHRPPNLNIINGAAAVVEVYNGRGKITQTLA